MFRETSTLDRPRAAPRQDAEPERPGLRALSRTIADAEIIRLDRPSPPLVQALVKLLLAWSGMAVQATVGRLGAPEAKRLYRDRSGSAQIIDFDALRLTGEPHFGRRQPPKSPAQPPC